MDISFTAKVSRDTTPRGAVRSTFVGSSLRGRVVETQDEQTFIPGIAPIVTESADLTMYPDSLGSGNVFRGETLIAAINDCAAGDLDIWLAPGIVSVDFPDSLINELKLRLYRTNANEIEYIARSYDEDPTDKLREMRTRLGL